jgi:hypothetical protein
MNNLKNFLIAILIGLLALTLSTQNSNGAPAKTYDAVMLAEYVECLYYDNTTFLGYVTTCERYKPRLTVKTYDALKLAEYSACLFHYRLTNAVLTRVHSWECNSFKPKG